MEMRDTMWIYAALILLLSEAWSKDTGTNQITAVNFTSTPQLKIHGVRNLTFNLGSDADLICSSKTWKEILFIIWKINLKYKQCRISLNNDGQSEDLCNDGKSLRNTSSAQSYLHIPTFSTSDVGVYKCESVYKGGNENYEINVDIRVPPTLTTWLEREDGKMVAVCKAERGKPAANISWSHMRNSSEETLTESHGLFTVESRLELPEGTDTENLRCTVRHLFWDEEQTLTPQLNEGYSHGPLIIIVLVIVVFLTGILFFVGRIKT